VRRRPTFVKWSLLPAILRLVADLRTPDELYDFGFISQDAYRIAQALDGVPAPLVTGELRKIAGFPVGKAQSAAYHKALAELEHRLLVTTEFGEDEANGSKCHALIFDRRRNDLLTAEAMTVEGAVETFLRAYLPAARYAVPAQLARHLRVPAADITGGLTRLDELGLLTPVSCPGINGSAYLWIGDRERP
jgi:hypothetical protein